MCAGCEFAVPTTRLLACQLDFRNHGIVIAGIEGRGFVVQDGMAVNCELGGARVDEYPIHAPGVIDPTRGDVAAIVGMEGVIFGAIVAPGGKVGIDKTPF